MLLVQPAEELLKPRIGQNGLDGVKRVAQFVVGPGFVDEILAGVTGRNDFGSAFAAWDHVVPACGD
jgi:hypothetical protein